MMVKTLFIFSLVVMVFVGFSSAAYAQEKGYPSKPIKIMLIVKPGGGVDLFFRLFSEELKKFWKVPVTVENQTGGGGTVAGTEVANAKKDGYTFLGIVVSSLTSMTVAKPNGPVNLIRDFDPILVNIGYAAAIVVTRGDSQFRTLKDVINYAKEKPGELICGGGSPGSNNYLELELLKRVAKVNISTLSYSGGADFLPQLLGGHIQIGMTSDVLAAPYIKAGKMRGLVGDAKSAIFPDIPTFAESGYPDVNLTSSLALVGPKGLPPAIIKTWHSALEVILKDPTFIASLQKLGFNNNFQIDPEKNIDFFKGDVKKYSQFSAEELGWQ